MKIILNSNIYKRIGKAIDFFYHYCRQTRLFINSYFEGFRWSPFHKNPTASISLTCDFVEGLSEGGGEYAACRIDDNTSKPGSPNHWPTEYSVAFKIRARKNKTGNEAFDDFFKKFFYVRTALTRRKPSSHASPERPGPFCRRPVPEPQHDNRRTRTSVESFSIFQHTGFPRETHARAPSGERTGARTRCAVAVTVAAATRRVRPGTLLYAVVTVRKYDDDDDDTTSAAVFRCRIPSS